VGNLGFKNGQKFEQVGTTRTSRQPGTACLLIFEEARWVAGTQKKAREAKIGQQGDVKINRY